MNSELWPRISFSLAEGRADKTKIHEYSRAQLERPEPALGGGQIAET